MLTLSSKYIFILIIISVAISIIYLVGYKKNVKLMKEIAKTLESVLKPKDKLYTYLGGVLGFSAEYKVDGFKKVQANLRLIPRQSALYLPFIYLTTGKDSLQILFWLNGNIKREFHIIKKTPLKLHRPKIFNENKLNKQEIVINNLKYEILFEGENFDSSLLNFVKKINPQYFNHLAITTENNIVYINLLKLGFDKDQLAYNIKILKQLSLQLLENR